MKGIFVNYGLYDDFGGMTVKYSIMNESGIRTITAFEDDNDFESEDYYFDDDFTKAVANKIISYLESINGNSKDFDWECYELYRVFDDEKITSLESLKESQIIKLVKDNADEDEGYLLDYYSLDKKYKDLFLWINLDTTEAFDADVDDFQNFMRLNDIEKQKDILIKEWNNEL